MGVIKNNDLTVLMTPLVAIIHIYMMSHIRNEKIQRIHSVYTYNI